LGGVASIRWFGIIAKSRLGSLHQAPHDRIEGYQAVNDVTVGAIALSQSLDLCGLFLR
jgi:hypothetical protein